MFTYLTMDIYTIYIYISNEGNTEDRKHVDDPMNIELPSAYD